MFAKDRKEKSIQDRKNSKEPQKTTSGVQKSLEWQVGEYVGTQSIRRETKERLGRQAEACDTDRGACGQWEITKGWWDSFCQRDCTGWVGDERLAWEAEGQGCGVCEGKNLGKCQMLVMNTRYNEPTWKKIFLWRVYKTFL